MQEMHYWLPAAVGLVILWNEFRLKRDGHERELSLNREKFEAERLDREERLKMLREEAESLSALSSRLGKSISQQLTSDTRWASQAMERAKLGAYGKTLFGERVGHFYDEKHQLAEQFVPLLFDRCRHILAEFESQRASDEPITPITVFVDSGTTLYPFFTEFGRAAVRAHENGETWIQQVQLVTNNLPGVEMLMDYGRRNPNNRYSELAIQCHLLPGSPLPIYSAVTGPAAVHGVKVLRRLRPRNHFIALVTGNWIRLDNALRYPVPLARGEGHIELKQAFIGAADEIYVVTPLGKIFVEWNADEINEALGFRSKSRDPDKQPYAELHIPPSVAHRMRLVTTTRSDGRLLSPLSHAVVASVGCLPDDMHQETYRRRFVEAAAGTPHHVFFPFSQLPDNDYEELQTEFPHRLTRRSDIREKYFMVRHVTERTPTVGSSKGIA